MSIEADLKQGQIGHLDLREFSAVASGMTVQEVVEQMRREHHNCAFVLKDKQLVGIFTERDVLQKVVMYPETWQKPIDEVMTVSPDIVAPADLGEVALDMMLQKRYRNIPVIDGDGNILGNVTQYAFIKFLADHFPQEVYNLPPDERVHKNRYGG